MQLSAEYWIARSDDPDEVLMTADAIDAFSRDALDRDPNMVDLTRHPAEVTGDGIEARIRAISRPEQEGFYYRAGGRTGPDDWARYERNINLAGLPASRTVPFALALTRADMRTWPTDEIVFKTQETLDLDRFQENALFPGDAVAVLHQSGDGQWWFVQSYNYAAWVRKDQLVMGDRDPVLRYRDMPEFLVVTGDTVATSPDSADPAVSGLSLDMGVRLPLAAPPPGAQPGPGQSANGGLAVELPVRGPRGELQFATAAIAPDQDVRRGYLPFTRRNLIVQTFKFLGERYGWGHSRNARDCTGLVSDVYRSMGILLPRNSSQQGRSPIGDNHHFPPGTSAGDKLKAIEQCEVGDLLYSTGHVMMYLGSRDGRPWVIHDLAGAGWMDENGKYHEREFSGVSVTPLVSLHMSRDITYLDEMYAIKRIR